MWPLLLMFLYSFSLYSWLWALAAISFFGLLAGLYALGSSLSMLSDLASVAHTLEPTESINGESGSMENLLERVSSKASLHLPDYRKIAILGIIGLVTCCIGLYREVTGYPVYEYHNVKVLRQLSPNSWRMQKDDGEFTFTSCPDYDAAQKIWPGYVMGKFRFEDRGSCGSIRREDLGVWWAKDSSDDFVWIDLPLKRR